MRTMYDDPFLQSREWRTVRMRALERDGAKCACCGKTAADGVRINVDHIKPRGRYPELALTVDNLQVLCDACNHGKGNWSERDWRSAASDATRNPANHQRTPAATRSLIVDILERPERAYSKEFDQFISNCRTDEDRCLSKLISSVRWGLLTGGDEYGGWTPTTVRLIEHHKGEFGDILAAALATWEEETRAPRS